MKNSISTLLSKNGWLSSRKTTEEQIKLLETTFEIELPKDYQELLLFSNGGALYGFETPVNIYTVNEVIALYKEFDFYENIPQTLIFGGDGGGIIFAFDLRSENKPVLFFNQGDTRYDNIIYSSESLTNMIHDVVANKIIT